MTAAEAPAAGRPRLTIARWMGWTAVVALNAGLLRAFVVQEMFFGGVLIFPTLQVALWRAGRTTGRARRFWLGFVVGGALAVVALFSTELVPGWPTSRILSRAFASYVEAVMNLAYARLPDPVAEHMDDHLPWYLAVVYFLPELAVALLGGLAGVVQYQVEKRRSQRRRATGGAGSGD